MNKNLGFYQVAVVVINKVGGPKKFLGLLASIGALLFSAGVAARPKLANFYRRLVKVFKGKTDEQILEQAEECQVVQEGTTEKGICFHVGEQIKVIY